MHSNKVMKTKITIITCCLLFVISNFANAFNIKYHFTKQGDKTILWDISNWEKSKDKYLNFGFSNKEIIIKIDSLEISEENFILNIDNAHLDYINFYAVDSNNKIIKTTQTGDRLNFNTRDIPSASFSFQIPKNTSTIFLKVKTEGQLGLPITINNFNSFYEMEFINNCFYWTFWGIVILSLFANLMFYFSVKDSLYLYNFFYALTILVVMSIDNGMHFKLFFPNNPNLNKYNLIFYLATFYPLIFTYKFLNINTNAPKLKFIFWGVLLMVIYIIFLNYTYGYNEAIIYFKYPLYATILSILGINIYFYIKKKTMHIRFYFFAWNIYLVFLLLYTLVILDFLPFTLVTKNFMTIGASIEILFVFISVMDKINFLEKEKEESKRNVIQILEEQSEYIKLENENLESKIKIRTQLLEEKNNEIEAKNKLINEQNAQLSENNINLEEQVKERTLHLSLANIELENKNDFLEQFTYITAHNLRAPIASILGLINISEIDKSPESLIEINKKILTSTIKLNTLVKDLSIFLSNAQNSVIQYSNIDFIESIDNIIKLIHIDIEHSNAKIDIINNSNVNSLNTINTYFSSIFYNLIQNSIKYRNPKIDLKISIIITFYNNEIIFKISDNGMGLKYEKMEDLFEFKNSKINPTLSNLGLGLFIVKKQIDALKGRISVESNPLVGSTFTIYLPQH